jgi:hypothetical protein
MTTKQTDKANVRGIELDFFEVQTDQSRFQIHQRIWCHFRYYNRAGAEIEYGGIGIAVHKWTGEEWTFHYYRHSYSGRLRSEGGPAPGGRAWRDNWKADGVATFALTPYLTFDGDARKKEKRLKPTSIADGHFMGEPVYVAVGSNLEPGKVIDNPPAPLFPEPEPEPEVETKAPEPDEAAVSFSMLVTDAGAAAAEEPKPAKPTEPPEPAAPAEEAEAGPFKFEVWPTANKRITQKFGARPDFYKQFGFPGHEGIDLASPIGTPYMAVAAGKVIKVSDKRSDGKPSAYGWHVVVEHREGYSTLYAHAAPRRTGNTCFGGSGGDGRADSGPQRKHRKFQRAASASDPEEEGVSTCGMAAGLHGSLQSIEPTFENG